MERASELNIFDEGATEEEILSLWQSLVVSELSEEETWHAIAVGKILDFAFGRTRNLADVEQ